MVAYGCISYGWPIVRVFVQIVLYYMTAEAKNEITAREGWTFHFRTGQVRLNYCRLPIKYSFLFAFLFIIRAEDNRLILFWAGRTNKWIVWKWRNVEWAVILAFSTSLRFPAYFTKSQQLLDKETPIHTKCIPFLFLNFQPFNVGQYCRLFPISQTILPNNCWRPSANNCMDVCTHRKNHSIHSLLFFVRLQRFCVHVWVCLVLFFCSSHSHPKRRKPKLKKNCPLNGKKSVQQKKGSELNVARKE